ncbi:hypothetical protein GCM10022416_00430 [Actinomadura keratinilytica]|uniref:DUF4189 domain-containing protein n=1 Tax=Actinomadura keratinilytica TaxID=547461 RepID=A0ABP7XVQ6_9ACTN
MQPPQPPHGGYPPGYGPPAGPPAPPGSPGWGPPGPQPPNNNPAIVIIVVFAAFVLLVGGGAVLWLLVGSDDSSSTPTAARSTLRIPTYSPPTYSPPTYSTPTYDPPTYTPRAAPSTESTYAPPRLYYGAIAVAPNGAVGKSWDYSSAAAARRRALNECPASGCKVLTTFVNGCGAVAYNPKTNKYWGGSGKTRSAAQKDAISNAGGGRWITWVCTTRY